MMVLQTVYGARAGFTRVLAVSVVLNAAVLLAAVWKRVLQCCIGSRPQVAADPEPEGVYVALADAAPSSTASGSAPSARARTQSDSAVLLASAR